MSEDILLHNIAFDDKMKGKMNGYDVDILNDYEYRMGKKCPDCDAGIQDKAVRCKPCAQIMRRKIEGQMKRLLKRKEELKRRKG